MALPVLAAPIALRLAVLGAAALIGALAAARRGPERVDIVTDDALDRLHEGGDVRIDPANGRTDAEARFRRVIGLGRAAWEVEAAMLGRLRLRRVR